MAEKKERSILERLVTVLSRRNYSKMELRNKFSEPEKYSAPELEQALAYLEQKGFLNDQRYAEDCVKIWKNRSYGPIKIRNKLRERGISAGVIAKVMAESEEDGNLNPLDLAVELLNKRSRSLRQIPDPVKQKGKAIRLLASRGFPATVAFQAFDFWNRKEVHDFYSG